MTKDEQTDTISNIAKLLAELPPDSANQLIDWMKSEIIRISFTRLPYEAYTDLLERLYKVPQFFEK